MPFKKPHHTPEPGNIVEDTTSGRYFIKPRGLNIVWGNDPRYWKVEDVAELIQVSWLEVSCSVKVTPGKKYKVKFHVKVKADGFGWNNTKVLVMAKVGKRGCYKFKEATLKPDNNKVIIPYENDLEIEVDANASYTELHFGLYEVWSGKWKGGLEIHGAEVIAV